MLKVLGVTYLITGALMDLWGLCFSTAFFPMGALAAVACMYLSWSEALSFVLIAGLFCEALLPTNWGSVTLPLVGATLLLQLLARHQFRTSRLSMMFLGFLLQSIFTVSLSMQWPPRTMGGGFLQAFESALSLLWAGLLTPLMVWGFEAFSRRWFGVDIEGRLKDL